MRDFNGHVQSIDGFQDHNGAPMLQLAETFSLEVTNLRPDCIARRYLPATSFEQVAEDFEENAIHAQQTTYEEFVGELLPTMCHYEKCVQSRGGARPKAW
ncbi:hypothetical protein MRX96_033553 [Rhipicephalus microplus]